MILELGPEGPFVLIPATVVQTINAYKDDRSEAGGILLGSYRGPHIEIVACTEPGSGDRRLPTLFDRRDACHQQAATDHWTESGGTITFVGEWHTHPEDIPEPSSVDLKTWEKVVGEAPLFPAIFLIRGRSAWWHGLGRARKITRTDRPTFSRRVSWLIASLATSRRHIEIVELTPHSSI